MMPMFRAPLSQQQIVVAILLVDMRSFRITSSKTSTQMVNVTQLLTRLYINLTYFDVAFFPKEITLAVIEEKRRIATADGKVDDDRL